MSTFLALLPGLFVPANFGYAQSKTKPKIVRCPDDAPTVGWYRNYSYGFSLKIPAGFKGYWNSVPCTKDENECMCLNDHGLQIPITKNAYLEVEANPWIAETRQENLEDAFQFRLEAHKEKGEETGILLRATKQISKIPATRIKLKYRDAKTGTKMIEESIVCLPQDNVHGSTVFEVYLVTPESSYSKHKLLLDSVLQSWRWRSRPGWP